MLTDAGPVFFVSGKIGVWDWIAGGIAIIEITSAYKSFIILVSFFGDKIKWGLARIVLRPLLVMNRFVNE